MIRRLFLCAALASLHAFAARPAPPPGYAYEGDLRPASLVLTNALAAGYVDAARLAAATGAVYTAASKPSAIYTPDGQTWTDATGCVWRIGVERGWVLENVHGESLGHVLLPVLANESSGEYAWELSPGSWRLYWKSFEWTLSMGGSVYVTMPGPRHLDTLSSTDEYGRTYALRAADLTITNIITRLATTNELAGVAATIPERVTNTVRAVQGLVYDESLGITWRQTMYDGNLYYVAVTNANITEVQ